MQNNCNYVKACKRRRADKASVHKCELRFDGNLYCQKMMQKVECVFKNF